MSNRCGGPVPQLEKLQNEPFLQRPYYRPGASMPIIPGSGAPGGSYPPATEAPYPSVSMPENAQTGDLPPLPRALNPIIPNDPYPSDLNPMGPSNNAQTRNPLIPNILPDTPTFVVPSNPLLPPGYQETLDFDSLQYMNGFLRTQIGRPCEVDFQIGTDSIQSRTGTLLAVGINYILLHEPQTNDVLTCDFYSIKFVRFYY